MRRHPYETICEPRSRPPSAFGARGRQSDGGSPTATFTHRAPLSVRSLTAFVSLLGVLAILASPADATASKPRAVAPPALSGKQLAKETPRAHARRRTRSARATAAAYYHPLATGSLLCEPYVSKISVGPLTARVYSGETLNARALLFRWTTSGWVLDVIGSTVQTQDGWVDHMTHWFSPDGTYDREGSSRLFNINVRGHYYAIAREMWWTDGWGRVIDRHYAWTTRSSGSYFCYI